jgi:hypothetical protein
MAFDPDKFLAQPVSGAFNPDEFLAAQEQKAKAEKFNQLNPIRKGFIGVGQAIHNLGIGTGQALRGGIESISPKETTLSDLIVPQRNSLSDRLGLPNQADVDALRKKEAYMDQSTAKNIGNIVGSALPFVATAAIPGVNTITGGALVGATSGALEPVGTGESRLKNIGIGGVAGGVLTGLGNKIASSIEQKQLANELLKSQNVTRDKTIIEALDAGYKIPPAATNPSFLNRTLESFAGKANIGQTLSTQNQEITNNLAKKALGLPESISLSDEILNGVRQEAGKAYQQIAQLDPHLAQDIEKLKITKNEANAYYKLYGRSAHPDDLKKAQGLRDQANQIETWIEDAVTNYGKPDLLANLRNARTQIAKTYEVENALNNATGNINARSIAKSFNKDVPLTGELATIGKFGSAFPKYTQPTEQIGTVGASKVKSMMAGLLGGGGYAAGGPIGAGIGVAAPLVLDDIAKWAYLKGNALPKYATSKSKLLAKKLLENQYTKPILSGVGSQQLIEALSDKEQQ